MAIWNESPPQPLADRQILEKRGGLSIATSAYSRYRRMFRNGSNFAGFAGLRSVLKTRPAWAKLDGRHLAVSWWRPFGVSRKVYILKRLVWRNKWGNYWNITLSPFNIFLNWFASMKSGRKKYIAPETLKSFLWFPGRGRRKKHLECSFQDADSFLSEGGFRDHFHIPTQEIRPTVRILSFIL